MLRRIHARPAVSRPSDGRRNEDAADRTEKNWKRVQPWLAAQVQSPRHTTDAILMHTTPDAPCQFMRSLHAGPITAAAAKHM